MIDHVELGLVHLEEGISIMSEVADRLIIHRQAHLPCSIPMQTARLPARPRPRLSSQGKVRQVSLVMALGRQHDYIQETSAM